MNNFPENENKPQEEEFSTVFSNPQEHKSVKIKSGNKKRLKIVISALAVIAVLVSGVFAAVKFIPEKEDNNSTPSFNEIEVLNQKSDDYKTVTVKNKNGSFKFYSVVTKSEDKDTEDTVDWYLEGYDKSLVSTSSISSVISSLGEIYASREITEKSSADCGLENPQIQAEIVTNDGAEFSILLGAKSPDNSGIYIKLSTKDNIYLLSDSLDETLTFEALSFANSDAISGLTVGSDYSDYTEDGKLTTFDSITVSGKNFDRTIVIKPNKDEATVQLMPYLLSSHQNRTANGVDKLLSFFNEGVSVIGAYSFDVTDNTIQKLGLDNPDFTATINLKDYSYTYKFKLQSDGNYAVITDDSIMVKKVSPSLEVLNYKTTDFYQNWVFMESIDNISNLTVKIGEKDYSFDIKLNADDEDNKYVITYNGQSLDTSKFQDFYRFCISLACSDYTVDSLSTSDEASLIYTYKDNKSSLVTVSFKKASATKYQYSINGEAMGKINASDFNKLDKYLQQIVKGEKITFN